MDFFFQIRPQDKYFFEIVYFGASTFNPKCLPVANLSLKYTQTLEVHTTFFNAVQFNRPTQALLTYLPKF